MLISALITTAMGIVVLIPSLPGASMDLILTPAALVIYLKLFLVELPPAPVVPLNVALTCVIRLLSPWRM